MRVVQTLALWACSTLLGGCGWLDWVVGNEDTEVRCDHVWQFGPLIRPAIGADPRIWVRVRDEDIEAGKVRVLSTRVRQALGELGWTVDDARLPGITWLELCALFQLRGGKHQQQLEQEQDDDEPGQRIIYCIAQFKQVIPSILIVLSFNVDFIDAKLVKIYNEI